jgi:hypothetical protein
MTCATQMMWLSQAILLKKMKQNHNFTPDIWLAYLMKGVDLRQTETTFP